MLTTRTPPQRAETIRASSPGAMEASASSASTVLAAADSGPGERRTGPSPKLETTSSIPTRLAMATPFQRPSPWWASSYPAIRNGISGAASSASLVSCISSTSGTRWTSHSSTRGRRALSELTFQVAMRTCGSVRRLVAPALLSGEVELGRVGDAHDGQSAGLDGIGDHQVRYVRHGAGHVEGDDRDAYGL